MKSRGIRFKSILYCFIPELFLTLNFISAQFLTLKIFLCVSVLLLNAISYECNENILNAMT